VRKRERKDAVVVQYEMIYISFAARLPKDVLSTYYLGMISDVPSDASLASFSWSGVWRLRLDLLQHTLVSDFLILGGGGRGEGERG